jgi:hypothetical protein
MTERFELTAGLKKNLYIMIGIGVLGLLGAFFLYPENHHSRFWSNILVNSYFFTGIGIFGIFFVAANTLGYSGWIAVVKRVILSLSGFVKIGALFALLIIVGMFTHQHNLYNHWFDEHHYAELANTKQFFLNPIFWTARIVVYFLLWIFVGDRVIKAFSDPNSNQKEVYKKSKLWAALWIVIFAVTESFVSWDMIMSTDPHWYSTLFGWYNFASYGCAAFAFSILLTIYLKSKGYLAQVNENHIHDLGKFLFAFSIFWTYLWFSQFMLQWYGNIPEDTIYWVKRFDVPLFKFTILLALALNFLFPLLVILKRGNKRNFKVISTAAVVIIFGHYVDFFNMVMPEPNFPVKEHHGGGHHASAIKSDYTLLAENVDAAKEVNAHSTDTVLNESTTEEVAAAHASSDAGHEVVHASATHGDVHGAEEVKTYAGLGLVELMILVGFLGVFLLTFFDRLSKAPLINESDPYLKESLRHHVEYA